MFRKPFLVVAAAVLAVTATALAGVNPATATTATGRPFFDQMATDDAEAASGLVNNYMSEHAKTPTVQWVNLRKQQRGATTVRYYHEQNVGYCVSATNTLGTLDTAATGKYIWNGTTLPPTVGTRADIEASGTPCGQVLIDLDNHTVPADPVSRRPGLDGGIRGVITGPEIDAQLFDDVFINDATVTGYRGTHNFENPSARWVVARLQHTGSDRVFYTDADTGPGFCVAAWNHRAFIGDLRVWFGTGFKRATVGTKTAIAKTHTGCGRYLRALGY